MGQGKRKSQLKDAEAFSFYALIGMLIIGIILIILNTI